MHFVLDWTLLNVLSFTALCSMHTYAGNIMHNLFFFWLAGYILHQREAFFCDRKWSHGRSAWENNMGKMMGYVIYLNAINGIERKIGIRIIWIPRNEMSPRTRRSEKCNFLSFNVDLDLDWIDYLCGIGADALVTKSGWISHAYIFPSNPP